ncbi:uncharacterized protein [Ptychodera flava]|uniref:uncharacterized protein n=1 Tax=Ptychodera flava TaxID=63121 RepID=UPI003969F088
MSSNGSLSGKSISTGSRKSSRSSSSGASVKSGRENGSKRGNGRRKSNESARVLSETDQSRSSGKTSKSDGRLDQIAVTSSDTSQSKVRTESGESRERMLRESLHKIQDKNDGTEAEHLQITDKRKVSGDNLPSETASDEGGDHGVEKSIVDGAAEGIKGDSAGDLTEIHSVKRVSVEKIESAENAGVPEQSSRKSSGEFRSDAEEDGKLKTRSDDETESNKPTSDNDETGTKSEEKIESSEAKPNGQTVQEPPREDEDAKNDDDTLSDGKESKSEIKKESTVGLNEDRSTEKIDSADKNISIDAIKPGESDDRSTEKIPSEVLEDVENERISKHGSSDKADSTVSADDKSEHDTPSEEKIEAGANGEHGQIPAKDESSSKVEKDGDGERGESEGESNTEDTEVDKTDVDQSHDVEKRESTTEVDKKSKEDISTGVKLESSESATGEVEILDVDRHTDDGEGGKVDNEEKSESAGESAESGDKPNIGSSDKVGEETDESKEDSGETTPPDKDVDHEESDSAVSKRESQEATEVETKGSVRDAVTFETGDGAEYESPSIEVGSVGPLTSDTSTKVTHASARTHKK